MPTPKYCFVCRNDFERTYPIKSLIKLAVRRFPEIGIKVKLAYIQPKRRKPTDKNGFALVGCNPDLWIEGPSTKNRILSLIEHLKGEVSSRY
jgi:hypothetical protein